MKCVRIAHIITLDFRGDVSSQDLKVIFSPYACASLWGDGYRDWHLDILVLTWSYLFLLQILSHLLTCLPGSLFVIFAREVHFFEQVIGDVLPLRFLLEVREEPVLLVDVLVPLEEGPEIFEVLIVS